MLRLADSVAATAGILDRPIRADRLMARARRVARLRDFGDESFVDPLQRLLESCVAEAELGVVGRIATQWDVVRFLSNLLRLRHEEVARPAILREPIDRPIFITGLPRTGSTFLYKLLMADPCNQAPRVWQTMYPYPRRAERTREPAARIAAADRQLRTFERMAPDFAALHPLRAVSPQECSEITAHVFASLRFDSTHQIPSYRAWLDTAGHLDAYRFHRRFLQHLQHQSGPVRWVLKCPDHLFALREIQRVYPDARVVFIHRDPLRVLLSVARLTEVVRRPFTRRLDPAAIGRQESNRWHEGAALMIDAARADAAGRPPFAEPICHIWHADLVARPVETIGSIYRHFSLPINATIEARMRDLVARPPDGGYGAARYRFEDHGLDEATEREKFSDYTGYFNIPPEYGGRAAVVVPAAPRGAVPVDGLQPAGGSSGAATRSG